MQFFWFKSGVQGFGFRVEGLRLERLTSFELVQ